MKKYAIGENRRPAPASTPEPPPGGAVSRETDVPKGQRLDATDLYVLRTTMRRLAHVGLSVFDEWAKTADYESLQQANDVIKPLLEQLLLREYLGGDCK